MGANERDGQVTKAGLVVDQTRGVAAWRVGIPCLSRLYLDCSEHE